MGQRQRPSRPRTTCRISTHQEVFSYLNPRRFLHKRSSSSDTTHLLKLLIFHFATIPFLLAPALSCSLSCTHTMTTPPTPPAALPPCLSPLPLPLPRCKPTLRRCPASNLRHQYLAQEPLDLLRQGSSPLALQSTSSLSVSASSNVRTRTVKMRVSLSCSLLISRSSTLPRFRSRSNTSRASTTLERPRPSSCPLSLTPVPTPTPTPPPPMHPLPIPRQQPPSWHLAPPPYSKRMHRDSHTALDR